MDASFENVIEEKSEEIQLQESEVKQDISNLASKDTVEKHVQAIKDLRDIININNISINNWWSNLTDIHQSWFKKPYTTEKKMELYEILHQLSNNLYGWKGLKKQHKYNHFRKYNMKLNSLRGKLSEISPLKNILFVNEDFKLINHTLPKTRVRIDTLMGGPLDTTKIILKTKGDGDTGGARINFENSSDALACIKACLEKSTFNDLTIGQRSSKKSLKSLEKKSGRNIDMVINVEESFYLFSLRIHLPRLPKDMGGDGKDRWIKSDDSSLKHILCNSNPPRNGLNSHNKYLYYDYIQFIEMVKNCVLTIITNSHNNVDCPFTILHCCREGCTGSQIVHKMHLTKCVKCSSCSLELCRDACGRIYHGENSCELTFDEASETFISENFKRCPNCNSNYEKISGCNHMTCSNCGCEFCFICGREFIRDDNNQYLITTHFSEYGGQCPQYT